MPKICLQEHRPALCALAEEITGCERCPRLAGFLAEARERFPDYWARPVPGYGDPDAPLVILGLAPGYHGANRHGRVFCGDDSGKWLWGALHELGLCSHAHAPDRHTPLVLRGVYVNNVVRCVPPRNRPVAAEIAACRRFLERELALLREARVVVALGRIAHDAYLDLRAGETGDSRSRRPFRHGALHAFPSPPTQLFDSYHPSRQNTHTGVLTWERWLAVLRAAARAAGLDPARS